MCKISILAYPGQNCAQSLTFCLGGSRCVQGVCKSLNFYISLF